MLVVKMTEGYCNWVTEITSRYPLNLIQYNSSTKGRIIAKLDSCPDLVLVGIFDEMQQIGKVYDRRDAATRKPN